MSRILHISVNNKIATYRKLDGAIVCNNGDYQIKFAFDSEWDGYGAKTARFIWNGQYHDEYFTGDTCDVPAIQNATEVKVGVYTGGLSTTTPAIIECYKSILCEGVASNEAPVMATFSLRRGVTPTVEPIEEEFTPGWSGKNMNVVGDSILEGSVDVIKDILGLDAVNNYGAEGSGFASTRHDSECPPVVTRYVDMDLDADIILVHAGTEDYAAQVPLGDENSRDITTFNGALNVIMSGLRDMYPDKLIIFNNILHRYNDRELATVCGEYRKALESRCKANRIVFYDAYAYSGFDFAKGYYDHVLTDDGLHPNQKGANILGRKIAGFINWQ